MGRSMENASEPGNQPQQGGSVGSKSGATRRQFLQLLGTGTAFLGSPLDALAGLAPVIGIDNPLAYYPNRGWEKLYLDQYRYDRTFTWICAPNDTHMCRMRAFVRNGVLVRSEQNYDHDRYPS